MPDFVSHVNPKDLTPSQHAHMDQSWARANEGCDMLVELLRAHYETCTSGPPCVSNNIAQSFELLAAAGPAEVLGVLHAALHRLATAPADG